MPPFTAQDAADIVRRFDPAGDDLARKSQELVLQMLEHTDAPFSRDQFEPGHITCTALVLHPFQPKVLFMHHHRLHRWLLPGGHVEVTDPHPSGAAAREAMEETNVTLDAHFAPFLAGIDVHGIPPKKDEPFHLHHDLIWCLRATSEAIERTPEAREVCWGVPGDWDRLQIADSIRRAIGRADIARV